MLASTKHQYESAIGFCLGKSFPLFFSRWWLFWAKYLWLAVFFLQALWIYHLQACKHSAETPVDTLWIYVTIHFVCDLACGNSLFSCRFQIFVLIFKSLIIMYLIVDIFEYVFCGVHWASLMCRFIPFIKLGIFSASISSNSLFCLFLSFWDSIMHR